MTKTPYWEEVLPAEQLNSVEAPLDEDQVKALWRMFVAITEHWKLEYAVNLIKSRWLDMLQARRDGDPDYTAEYINAAAVFTALEDDLGPAAAAKKMYGDTRVTEQGAATTRLEHAKFYVGNDFIKCFLACGGYRALTPGRNYTGFMGGSRYREWAPIRTGKKS